jgi:hypothetical protein
MAHAMERLGSARGKGESLRSDHPDARPWPRGTERPGRGAREGSDGNPRRALDRGDGRESPADRSVGAVGHAKLLAKESGQSSDFVVRFQCSENFQHHPPHEGFPLCDVRASLHAFPSTQMFDRVLQISKIAPHCPQVRRKASQGRQGASPFIA